MTDGLYERQFWDFKFMIISLALCIVSIVFIIHTIYGYCLIIADLTEYKILLMLHVSCVTCRYIRGAYTIGGILSVICIWGIIGIAVVINFTGVIGVILITGVWEETSSDPHTMMDGNCCCYCCSF